MYQLTLSFALASAIIGYIVLSSLMNPEAKAHSLFYPGSGLTTVRLYRLTLACFFYFGFGCLLLLIASNY